MKYEYIEDNPETWVKFEPPPKDEGFERELVRIAGLNPHGRPNLKLVWGGTEKNDRTEYSQLKYHCGYTVEKCIGFKFFEDGAECFVSDEENIPEDAIAIPVTSCEPLGLPRWIIEKWTSPQDLERRDRFSNRVSKEGFKILREFPREGIYETWMIIDDRNNLYRDVGADILPIVEFRWQFDQLPPQEQEKEFQKWQAEQRRLNELKKHEYWEWALDPTTRLPYEERMKREHMANKIKEDYEEYFRDQKSVSVYYSQR